VLTAADIVMKSPGGGIPPYELSAVLGRATTRALHADDFLSYDVITAANPQLARS
jgi:N-acetylneuraminate synthase/sialic acid synthase